MAQSVGGGVLGDIQAVTNTWVTQQIDFVPTKVMLWWNYKSSGTTTGQPQIVLLDIATDKYYMWWVNNNGGEVTGWNDYFYVDGSTIYYKQPDNNVLGVHYVAIKE